MIPTHDSFRHPLHHHPPSSPQRTYTPTSSSINTALTHQPASIPQSKKPHPPKPIAPPPHLNNGFSPRHPLPLHQRPTPGLPHRLAPNNPPLYSILQAARIRRRPSAIRSPRRGFWGCYATLSTSTALLRVIPDSPHPVLAVSCIRGDACGRMGSGVADSRRTHVLLGSTLVVCWCDHGA